MNADEALALAKRFTKMKKPGSTTAPYIAYNHTMVLYVKECHHPLAAVETWAVRGLFIPESDVKAAIRPYMQVVYKMNCGKLMTTILKIDLENKKIAADCGVRILTYTKFNGVFGYYFGLESWYEIADLNDYNLKSGPTKEAHFASKPLKSDS